MTCKVCVFTYGEEVQVKVACKYFARGLKIRARHVYARAVGTSTLYWAHTKLTDIFHSYQILKLLNYFYTSMFYLFIFIFYVIFHVPAKCVYLRTVKRFK